MKQFFEYAEESEDLKQARQKDQADYREFLAEMNRLHAKWTGTQWDEHPIRFSHLYDAPRPA
jgi:hypothetical protein